MKLETPKGYGFPRSHVCIGPLSKATGYYDDQVKIMEVMGGDQTLIPMIINQKNI